MCTQCTSRTEPCEYLANLSETRHGATKRKHRELQAKYAAHDELYELLASRSEAESLDIVRRIKSGVSIEDLIKYVKDGDLLLQLNVVPESRRRYSFPLVDDFPASLLTPDNGYVQSLMYQAAFRNGSVREADLDALYQPQYLTPYHGAQLVEPLLSDVCASRWTNVVTSNRLFRQLLSSYILHQYRSVPCFRKELFLQDMAAGRTTFCSQLLVNAVLACASVTMAT